MGSGSIFSLPASTLIWLFVALILVVFESPNRDRALAFAVGSNSRAAHLMGVPVERTLVAAYSLSSLMACLGGLLLTAYIGAPSLGIGNQFMMTTVAATVVGGAVLTGGIGRHDRNRRGHNFHHGAR